MSATTKWNSPPRPEERRSSLRLKVSSLIYAQIGDDNGGIVLNLGIDGLACHAAHNLNADRNSALNLRLRGSGLNAQITGELAWIAETQKEVGISFKSLPAHVRQDIADWIARESQPATPSGPEQTPLPKTVSVIADIALPEKRTVLRSLSAALALSHATSKGQDPPTVAAVSQADSSLQASHVESTAVIFPLGSTSETFPATEKVSPAAEQIADRREDREHLVENNSPVVLESPNTNLVPNNLPITSELPANEIGQLDTEVIKASASPQKPAKAAPSAPPQSPTEIRNYVKIGKNTVAKPTVGTPISATLSFSHVAMRAEKWIPQSCLSVWKGLNDRHKKLFTHIGSGCIGLLIGLMLVLAMTMSHGSSARSSESKPAPQSTIQPVSPDLRTDDLQDGQDPGLATKSPTPITSKSQSDQPKSSIFSKIINNVFGDNADGTHKISDYQMGLEVWTSQSTGYYYCSDDPYAKQVQPGSPMLQGDALQAGYRPRLGQFCN
ncbi:MAG TPA: PilZ domain-containing protein [Candidatus Saccharimonadales bacterium]|nr:PilZ domain-containing protein [Candidatus Saccharimonadales bacterium]